MRKIKGVRKYARQFLASIPANEVPQALDPLAHTARLLEERKDFRRILASPVFNEGEQKKIIAALAEKAKMPEKVKKFLIYVSAQGAMAALPEIADTAMALYRERQNKAKAVVTTSIETTATQRDKIIVSLKKITGKEIEPEFAVDPSLLGGIRIQVNSTMYDSSIKGQLVQLKDKLIKG